jgi:hypothetical protein
VGYECCGEVVSLDGLPPELRELHALVTNSALPGAAGGCA